MSYARHSKTTGHQGAVKATTTNPEIRVTIRITPVRHLSNRVRQVFRAFALTVVPPAGAVTRVTVIANSTKKYAGVSTRVSMVRAELAAS